MDEAGGLEIFSLFSVGLFSFLTRIFGTFFDQSSTTFFNKSAGLGQHQKVDTASEQEV